jgi:hypothetical protein
MSAVNDMVVSGNSAQSSGGAVNLSLIKLTTITQTLLGVAVTGLVVVATVVTVVLVATGVSYDPPVAKPDSAINYKTILFKIYPLLNDYDPKGGNVTIISIGSANHGVAELYNGQYLTYQSVMYWAGVDYVNYTISNGRFAVSSVITITIEDHAPTPIAQSYTVLKNSKNNVLPIFKYTNAAGQKVYDVDHDIMALYNCSQPYYGQITYDTENVYYTPVGEFLSDNMTYCVTDFNLTSCDTISITIANTPPVAVPDYYTIPKYTVQALYDMSNDYDPDGNPIKIVNVGVCTTGSATISFGGQYVQYTTAIQTSPYTDSYEYTIFDGELYAYSYAIVDVVDTPPTAGYQVYTVHKNTFNNTLPFNYSDTDALDTLTVLITQPPKFGTYQLSVNTYTEQVFLIGSYYPKTVNNYTLTYTPTYDTVDTDYITYLVNDGYNTAVGTIEIHVINDPPIARTDYFLCHKNWNVTGNVIANDTDPDGDQIMLNLAGGQQTSHIPTTHGGYYNYVSNSSIQYFPIHNFIGIDTATYNVTDIQINPANDLVSVGQIIFTVIDDPPTPLPDFYVVGKGLSKFMNVMANDSDPNWDPITLVSAGTPQSRAPCVIDTEDGITGILYTALNQVYQESWYYTIADNDNETASTTVTVKVIDLPPVAVPDYGSVAWNRSVTIDVCLNDTDPNPGDQAILTVFSPLLNGGVSAHGGIFEIVSGKAIKYTPPNGFVGIDTFQYQAFDQILPSNNSATVTINVYDNPPIANPASLTMHWSSSTSINLLAIRGNGDPDGDPIYVSNVGNPTHGQISQSGSVVTYSGKNDYVGPDSFTYTLSDWKLTSSSYVNVTLTNTPPVANPVTIKLYVNNGATIGYVHDIDYDPDNDPFYVYSVQTPSGFQGILAVTSDKMNVVYTPTSWTGTQYATYTITDGPSFTVGDITIIVIPVIPVVTTFNCSNVNYQTSVEWRVCADSGVQINVTANSTNLNKEQPLVFAAVPSNMPTYGTLQLNNGVFTYTCNQGTGIVTDMFEFTTACGTQNVTNVVTVTVTDRSPIAANDQYTLPWNFGTFLANVTANDTDPDGDPFYIVPSSIPSTTTNLGASLSVVNGKLIQYSLPSSSVTPSMLNVPDTFSYYDTDTVLNSNTANVQVTLYDNNPTGANYAYTIKWSSSQEFVATCTDPDSFDTATVQSITAPFTGKLTNVSPSTYVYTPSSLPPQQSSYNVTYTIPYTCTDGLLTGSGSVAISVYNIAPTIQNKSVIVNRNYDNPTNTFSGLLDANDIDGDIITVNNFQLTPSSLDSYTSTSWSPNSNNFTLTVENSFEGTKVMTWTVFDGQLYSAPAFYSVTYLNQPPVCTNYSASTYKLYPIEFSQVPSGCMDPNNDPLTYQVTGTAAFGTISQFSSSNVVTYTPAVATSGTFQVPYVATDIDGATTTNYFNITVINRAPVSYPYTYDFTASASNVTYKISTYLTDSKSYDPDQGDVISIANVYGGTCNIIGSTTLTATNVIAFIPNTPGWNGTCNFNVVITDNDNHPLTSTNVITINMAAPIPPIAVDDYTTVNQNAGLISLQTSWMLSNDIAPPNTQIEFVGLVPCSTSGYGYCQYATPQYVPSGGVVLYQVDPNNCVTDKFQYMIQTVGPDPMYSTATVFISFTNCYCKSMIDLYFILDTSFSIGSTNFNILRTFSYNITKQLFISPTAVNVGVVMFGFDGYLYQSLSSSASQVQSTINSLPWRGEDTNTKAGIYSAMADILGVFPNNGSSLGYANGRINVPKVFLIITDGVSDAPCGCSQNSPGMYYAVYPGCQYMYNTNQQFPSQCNSPVNYPGQTCTDCNFNTFINEYNSADGGQYDVTQSGCMPCADPTTVTRAINSWFIDTNTKTTSSPYPQFPLWKVIAMGIGPLVTNNDFAIAQINNMTYNGKAQVVTWSNLNSVVNAITSSACNTQQSICPGNVFEVDFVSTNPVNSGEMTQAAAKVIFTFSDTSTPGTVTLSLFIENEIGQPGQPSGGATSGTLTGVAFDLPSGLTVSSYSATNPYPYLLSSSSTSLSGTPFNGKSFTFGVSSGTDLVGGGSGGLTAGQSVTETLTITGTGITASAVSSSVYQYYQTNVNFAAARFKSLSPNSASDKVSGSLSCPSVYTMFPN